MRLAINSFFVFLFLTNHAFSQAPSQAKWTIMVYLNADNNLEECGIWDFDEIAKVGSTSEVNVIVQMDRIGKYCVTSPQWTQTLRFRVTKGMKAIPKNASKDLGEVNMGLGDSLRDFVRYCQFNYRADHYFLIIWDHGQGYRGIGSEKRFNFRSTSTVPFKSVSNDETDKDKLYNREIQDALNNPADPITKLDVIGFDACLMAMVETAYAMRDASKYMVASEEIESGYGWDYTRWLGKIIGNPNMTDEEAAKQTVDSYREACESIQGSTYSAIDLSKISLIASQISELADALSEKIDDSSHLIEAARKKCKEFAPEGFGNRKDYFRHIDLGYFCEMIADLNISPIVTNQAKILRKTLASTVISCYAHESRTKGWGSYGLAIYFPKGNDDYINDRFTEKGYEQENTLFPVEFVQKYHWDEFLHSYWRKIK
ncbi:MAG: hypothetical protein EHM45_02155 [Desulfobacteraceae bacterium]|nr:MAG: hypothetical protein EHM45_02155 [Desulfobacteraceae bacterium]